MAILLTPKDWADYQESLCSDVHAHMHFKARDFLNKTLNKILIHSVCVKNRR